MTSYHTRRQRPEEPADDPERLAIREALAFGKALYDVRTTLGLSVAELALRASFTEDDMSASRKAAPSPPSPLLRHLAADHARALPQSAGVTGRLPDRLGAKKTVRSE